MLSGRLSLSMTMTEYSYNDDQHQHLILQRLHIINKSDSVFVYVISCYKLHMCVHYMYT